MEAEDILHNNKKIIINKRILNNMKMDVDFGMLFSNLVMFFIILTTGAVLYKAGIRQIDTVGQAAKALEPLTGKFTYLLFAIGIIGTGFLAIPVLYGLTAPVMIAIIMHICNNKKVMGEFTNKRWSNVLGTITLLLMSVAALALIYFQLK